MLRLPVLIVNRSRTSLVVILLVIAVLNSNVWSQQPIPTPEDLLYRQVKVEEGDLDEVLAGTIPVLRSQFNLMVGAINSQTRQQLEELPDYRQGGYIRQALYYGAFQGGQIVNGQAVLGIEAQQDAVGLIPLSPLSLALNSPQWVTPVEDGNGENRAAITGTTDRNTPVLKITESGELIFNWSLSGSSIVENERKFSFEIPQSESSYLVLDLPSELLLHSTQGIVWLPEGENVRLPVDGLPELSADHSRWIVQLGSQARTILTVHSDQGNSVNENGLFYRQNFQYSINPEGIGVQSQLTLESVEESRQQIVLTLAPELELIRVSHEGTELALSRQDESVNRWTVGLNPDTGTIELDIEAFARVFPLQPQVLPSIAVDQGIWRQGQVALEISNQLELYRFDIQGAIESRVETIGTRKRRILEMYEPTPQLVVVTGHREVELHISQVSRYELDFNQLNLQSELRLTAATEAVNQLHFELVNDWRITSVTVGGGGREGQRIEQYAPKLSSVVSNGIVLQQIDFSEGIKPEADVTLVMSFERSLSGGQVNGNSLQCMKFPNQPESPLQQKQVVLQQHLLGLTAKQPRILAISGADAARNGQLPPSNEQVLEQALLRDVGTVFQGTQYLQGLQITSVVATQSFDSNVQTVVEVGEVVVETTRLQITPVGTPVRKVEVLSTGLTDIGVQWTLKGTQQETTQSDGIFNVVTSELDGGQRWVIELVEPTVTEFELVATRKFNPTQLVRLPLYRIPDAKAFEATIEVGWGATVEVEISREPTMERILPQGTVPISGSYRKAYQYTVPVGTPPQVSISSMEDPLEHFVWNAHVHSKYLIHGFSSHEVRYLVERHGQQDLQVDLPDDVNLESVWLGDQRIQLASIRSSESPNSLFIPVNADQRFSKIRIRFTSSAQPLGFKTLLEKPLPEVRAKTLQSYWSVAVPPGFELANHSTDYSIAARLLGPWLQRNSSSGDQTESRQFKQYVAKDSAQMTIRSLVERAASMGQAVNENRTLSWAQWLYNVDLLLAEELNSTQLAVDFVALEAVGINPLTQLNSDVSGTSGTSAIQWLRDFGLAFVLDSDRLILTSDRWLDEKSTIIGQIVVIEDRLRPVLETYELAGGSVVTLEDWVLGRRVLSLLSQQEVKQLHETLKQDLMWTYDSGVEQPQQGVSLVVYNKSSLISAAWSSLLVWIGVLLWLCRRNWRLAFVLPPLTACLALFVNKEFVEFGSQGFVASLCVTVYTVFDRLVTSFKIRQVSQEFEFELQARPNFLTSLLFTLLLFGGSSYVTAYQPPAILQPDNQEEQQARSTDATNDDERQRTLIHSVYLPINEEGKDVGEYLYLADEFYQSLRKWYADVDRTSEAWMITSANYQVLWEPRENNENIVIPSVHIQYDIELGEGLQRVTLPFSSDECSVRTIRVNELDADFQWLPNAGGLQVLTDQEGNVELKLEVLPVIDSQDGIGRFELTIPGVPEAVLETSPLSDEHKILLSGIHGQTRVDPLTKRLAAALGGTEQVGVVWAMADVEIAGVSVLESSEYYWLKIAPHSVVMDVLLQVEVVAGRTQQFSLNVDPRLRLLPIRSGQIISEAPRIRYGDLKTLYFTLQRPVSTNFEVQLSFYLEDVSGIGNVPVPEITPVVQRRRERWLALSVKEDLTWHSSLQPVEAEGNELFSKWGTPDQPPQAIYSLSEELLALEEPITTLPRVVKTEVAQTNSVVVDSRELLTLYHAELLIEDGQSFQQRYRVPEGSIIESFTLQQDGAILPARIQFDQKGILTAFTDAGVTGEVTVEVRSRLPLRTEVVKVPVITHENGIVIDEKISVIQRSDVIVELEGQDSKPVVTGGYVESLAGRLLTEFDSATEANSSTLRVRPNEVELRGAASGGLVEIEGQWRYVLQADLSVAAGIVSELQLLLKDIQFESAEVQQGDYLLDLNQYAAGDYLVTLRPKQLQNELISFQIAFELEQSDGILTVPEFSFVASEASNIQHFFFAPLQLEGQQQIEWDGVGAQRITQWSTEVIPDEVKQQSHAVFLGMGNTDIRSRGFVQSATQLQVEVASYELAVIDKNHIVGLARFDVLPTRGSDLSLVWPEMWVLEGASIQGTSVVAQQRDLQSTSSESNTRVVIPLLSDGQIQQVDIVFTLVSGRKLAAGSNLLQLPVPENEVGESNITIQAADTDYASLEFASDNVEAGSLEMLLQQEVAWATELVNNRLSGDFEVEQSLLAEQQYWQSYQDRLQVLTDVESQTESNLTLTGLPEAGFGYRDFQVLQTPGIRLTGHTSGVLSQVLVRAELHSSVSQIWKPLGVVFAIAVSCGVVYFLTEQGWLANWISQAPMSPLVLLGVLWWTFLAPAVIGLVLILMGITGLILPDRRFIKVRFDWVRESHQQPSNQK